MSTRQHHSRPTDQEATGKKTDNVTETRRLTQQLSLLLSLVPLVCGPRKNMEERVLELVRDARLVLLEEDIVYCVRRAVDIRELSLRGTFACSGLEDNKAEEVHKSMKLGLFDHLGMVYFIFKSENERETFLNKVPSAWIPTTNEMQQAVLQQQICILVEEYAKACSRVRAIQSA
jgi:hypothetical protein